MASRNSLDAARGFVKVSSNGQITLPSWALNFIEAENGMMLIIETIPTPLENTTTGEVINERVLVVRRVRDDKEKKEVIDRMTNTKF